MVTQNHLVIPATVLEKFRSRGFPEGVTLTANHCSYLRSDQIEIYNLSRLPALAVDEDFDLRSDSSLSSMGPKMLLGHKIRLQHGFTQWCKFMRNRVRTRGVIRFLKKPDLPGF